MKPEESDGVDEGGEISDGLGGERSGGLVEGGGTPRASFRRMLWTEAVAGEEPASFQERDELVG